MKELGTAKRAIALGEIVHDEDLLPNKGIVK